MFLLSFYFPFFSLPPVWTKHYKKEEVNTCATHLGMDGASPNIGHLQDLEAEILCKSAHDLPNGGAHESSKAG